MTDHSSPVAKIGDIAADAGIRHVHVLAWRDLDDTEAGGSERHAAELCRRWAADGLEVTVRTSHAANRPPDTVRDGYTVTRRAGRYLVFPRAVASSLAGRHGGHDALVEIWNGMPFFTPLWNRGPRLTLLHHVHGDMWNMVLPPRLAALGLALETRIAPRLYRRSQVATLSESSRDTICATLGLRPERVAVVPPGVDDMFTPGGRRSPTPLVVAVGRLMPTKRFDELVRALAAVRHRVPGLELVIVGDGYERATIAAAVDAVDGDGWVTLTGRVDPDELLDHYRRAWMVASASSHEGWGMSITEAAACATPAVATDIAGHRDAVIDGLTGVLAADVASVGTAVADLLVDDARRAAMGEAARQRAAELSWDRTAVRLMELLAASARGPRGR